MTGRDPRTTIHSHHSLLRPAGIYESNFPITDCFSFLVQNHGKTIYVGGRPAIRAIEFDPAPSKTSFPWKYNPKPSQAFTLQGYFTPPFLHIVAFGGVLCGPPVYIYIYTRRPPTSSQATKRKPETETAINQNTSKAIEDCIATVLQSFLVDTVTN